MAEVPLTNHFSLALTVRSDEVPVIILTLSDDDGTQRTVHLTEDTGMDLVGDLAVAVRQLHHGHLRMPY